MNKPIVTLSDLANLIGRSTRTVRRMVKSGTIPQPTVLSAHEVEEGKNYFIVPTTSFGLIFPDSTA